MNFIKIFIYNCVKTKKERGRSVYREIATWLKQARKIADFQIQIRKLITDLYNNKPNLPALKDEFRQTSLV